MRCNDKLESHCNQDSVFWNGKRLNFSCNWGGIFRFLDWGTFEIMDCLFFLLITVARIANRLNLWCTYFKFDSRKEVVCWERTVSRWILMFFNKMKFTFNWLCSLYIYVVFVFIQLFFSLVVFMTVILLECSSYSSYGTCFTSLFGSQSFLSPLK